MSTQTPHCRFCKAELSRTFVALGSSPLCNKQIPLERSQEAEPFYPLHALVCDECYLVQLAEFAAPDEIFGDGEYTYFSSFSDSWLAHARTYVDKVTQRFSLGADSFAVEIASNDGYLLQWFEKKGIPVLGIEPASNCAEAAKEKGVESWVRFFGTETAKALVSQKRKANLLLGNNVLAHVPDINDFVAGMKIALADEGVITMEFPHLEQLVKHNQFDTIYHEHFSYLSFTVVRNIFAHHGITLFDVEELSTHGGSIRIYGRHEECTEYSVTQNVADLLERERDLGVQTPKYYESFAEQVRETKRGLLTFLIEQKRAGKTIVGYGAPGKGNTLLNYCGIRQDFIDYTVDRSPHKQNALLPGSRIPVLAPEKIFETKPDFILILPWNLREEIMKQMSEVRGWGGKFVVPIPRVEVL